MTEQAKHVGEAKLVIDGKTYEFPVIEGTEGERAIDITTLRSKTGYITLDPGYANTGSCQSGITFINGEKGILRHAGYPIDVLAEQSTFLEVAYLLLHGELPTREQLAAFEHSITYHSLLHQDVRHMYRAFPLAAHPMAQISSLISSLSTFYPDELDPLDPELTMHHAHRILAKLPTITAWAHKYNIGHPFPYPRNNMSYPENVLWMMFSNPCEDYELHPDLVKAIDTLLILHADHEQNCSTSTMRFVGSSHVNIYSSASAAIQALWGPLHGGANQAVIEMLTRIRDGGSSGREFLDRVKNKGDVRLMGFGHRVYKNYDPRAKVLKNMTQRVLEAVGTTTPLLEIAMELEEMALADEYFVERKLYPNVDFYSGIIYQAIGVPVNMFTAFFALGRMPGWLAHWHEQHRDPAKRIARPRQVYIGHTEREYVPIDKR